MHACKEETSNLCSWCSNNRWMGPETERIPQPVPDPNNRGHFMDVFQTESTGRTPDDYLPRKCLRDLHEELFCQCHKRWRFHQELLFKIQCWCEACYYIILIALKNNNMRKDIRTTEAEERKRQEAERTYKDFTSPHEFIPYRLSWAATL